jgi:arabinofuranosyltransferase
VNAQESPARSSPARGDWPWLASLLLVGCLALTAFALNAQALTHGQGGVPLDDAWIHFQFARNLARGDGLSFNPGEPTSGSTAPLWTLLLAAAYELGAGFPITGQVLSGISYLGMLAATFALGTRLTASRWAAWVAAMVVALNGRMVWAGLSALEICLFAALSMLAITSHLYDAAQRRYRLRTAALFGVAALCRPEGYLLFALSVGSFGLCAIRNVQGQNPKGVLRIAYGVLPATVLFCTLILPYLLFSWYTSGRPLPNTYHAKATVGFLPDRGFRDFLSVGAAYLILDNPLLLPFFLFGLILLTRHAPLVTLWAAGLPLAYAFIRASLYQHGRYLMPLIPVNGVAAMWGLLEARRYVTRKGFAAKALTSPRKTVVAAISAIIVAGTAWRLPAMARQYAENVDNINRMHVALGHWVADNVPSDTLIALNDIGAITYISERRAVDLAGLVTPEVTPSMRSPEQTDQLVQFMAEQGVEYVIVFPNWFPGLAERSDVLEEVHRVTLEDRSISGGETMVVYRANWRR